MNPKLEIHVGAALTSQNSDWQSDDRAGVITASFPSLAPNDEREAALFAPSCPAPTRFSQAAKTAGRGSC